MLTSENDYSKYVSGSWDEDNQKNGSKILLYVFGCLGGMADRGLQCLCAVVDNVANQVTISIELLTRNREAKPMTMIPDDDTGGSQLQHPPIFFNVCTC
jgi:hypothetical protein